MIPFTKHTHANGLDVIVHQDRHQPLVAVNLWYHVGSKNERPFTLDVSTNNAVVRFKPISKLDGAYAKLIPAKDSPVVVSCRTGHQASQTYFLLRHLLGYRRVSWYDGGWAEWASRPELPIETGGG